MFVRPANPVSHRLARMAFILACVAAFSAAPLLPQTDGIVWFDDYREALREAKQTHKPILVEFRCEP